MDKKKMGKMVLVVGSGHMLLAASALLATSSKGEVEVGVTDVDSWDGASNDKYEITPPPILPMGDYTPTKGELEKHPFDKFINGRGKKW